MACIFYNMPCVFSVAHIRGCFFHIWRFATVVFFAYMREFCGRVGEKKFRI